MFQTVAPEKVGVSSESLQSYLSFLEGCGITMHSILMMRGDQIFAEYYYAPFHKDFHHRMYSETKSYVAIAIGLLEEEGKLSLTDKIADLMPEKLGADTAEFLRNQTVEDMLLMCTGVQKGGWWFENPEPDKGKIYMSQPNDIYPAGMLWQYDSPGSSLLGELVEKLSGKSMMDYMREKLFCHMDAFQNADMVKMPNGVCWGASGLLCTTRDMAAMGRLVMNYGMWNGKRLMNEAYLRKATSKLVDNGMTRKSSRFFYHGYGYQIWKTEQDGFAFVGMGGQLMIALPHRDFLFVCTGDNQGYVSAYDLICNSLFRLVVDKIQDEPVPVEEQAVQRLAKTVSGLALRHMAGGCETTVQEQIDGKQYLCGENPMGIREFTFRFQGKDRGELHYTNTQGKKVLPFGIGKNVFCKFPQLGYSNERAGVYDESSDFRYDAAVSAGWVEPQKLTLYVQIIDKYFGNMTAEFSFRGDLAAVRMEKNAEDFLEEYTGTLLAQKA